MKSIVFSEAMIRQLQETGTAVKLSKVKPQPDSDMVWGGWIIGCTGDSKDVGKGVWFDQYPLSTKEVRIRCPHGGVGDNVRWVKETWATVDTDDNLKPSQLFPPDHDCPSPIYYEATQDFGELPMCGKTRPSMHMPRWASRYTVKCTALEVLLIDGVWCWQNKYEVHHVE